MLSDVRYRLRATFRRGAMEPELASEMQVHRERLVSKLMATGLTRAEAERHARLTMGGAEQVTETCRDARGVALVESTAQDLRYALRQLRRSPVFAIVVIASLGLGIGANTAIFSLVDAVLLRSLPVAAPHELLIVAPRQSNGTTHGVEYAEYRRLAAATPVFARIAAYGTTRVSVSVDGSVEPSAQGQLVSGSYFPVLVMRLEPRGSDQRGTPGTSERLDRTYRDLLDRVATIAGVRAASLAHYAPTTAVGYAQPMRLPSGETSVDRMMVYPGQGDGGHRTEQPVAADRQTKQLWTGLSTARHERAIGRNDGEALDVGDHGGMVKPRPCAFAASAPPIVSPSAPVCFCAIPQRGATPGCRSRCIER